MMRKWFQIHLSTAIEQRFVAGGLLWINFQCTTTVGKALVTRDHGWPLTARTVTSTYSNQYPSWNTQGAVTDIFIALIILLIILLCCEYFIRRREARKP
jgi:hypothetical protein